MLAIDEFDQIVKLLVESTEADVVPAKSIRIERYPAHVPVILRSMTRRKEIHRFWNEGRPFFYIDTGYLGNLGKKKWWHRVVPNNVQHTKPRLDLPSDRFELLTGAPQIRFNSWRRPGKNILLVTPSEKPCKFYGITRDDWVKDTIAELKKHTDREIIIRDKGLRRERIRDGSLLTQLNEDDIYAVVTYNSIAATEAVGWGVPAFATAPGACAAGTLVLNDLSKIESPLYSDPEEVRAWQNWLAYCQYTPLELQSGKAMKMIKEYELC